MSTTVLGHSVYSPVSQKEKHGALGDVAPASGRHGTFYYSNALTALASIVLTLSISRMMPSSVERRGDVIPLVTALPMALHTKVESAVSVPSRYRFPIPPTAKKVMIDIGLYNTILKPEEDEFVIAVDASLREIERHRLYSKCDQLQRCFLINAAVGKSEDPFLVLHQSTRIGGSSHVTNFDPKIWPMELKDVIVPMVSLKTLIESVPDHLPLPLCKTDTNGNDVFVIASAGDSLKRCERLTMEIVGDADHTGPQKQYETAIGAMSKLGFVLAPGQPNTKRGKGSYNIYFCRPDVIATYNAHQTG